MPKTQRSLFKGKGPVKWSGTGEADTSVGGNGGGDEAETVYIISSDVRRKGTPHDDQDLLVSVTT